MQGYLITAGAGGVLSLAAFFYGLDTGKKKERLVWEQANVETLVAANGSLSEAMEAKAEQIRALQTSERETATQIGRVETRIIEKIREVPVEKYIKMDGDCRIDYGIVGMRNAWAAGDTLQRRANASASSDLPLLGAAKVP